MKNRATLVVLLIGAIAVVAALYYRTSVSANVPRFSTAAVGRQDIVQTVEATGTLGAVTTVQVGSQVSGTIQSLHADFNSLVRKGQVIARLDPSLMQAQVDQAAATITRLEADQEASRAGLEDAQTKLRRAQTLSDQGLVARADLDTAQSAARQAEASLQGAQAQIVQARASLNQNKVNLSHTVITAPVDGIVISRNVDVGQTVAASMSAPTLFVIAKDLTEMQVQASVDEADIGRIQSGQAVTFRVDAYPTDTFTGTVSQVRLQPQVVQNVVSYTTVIDVPNPGGKLKPGMTANVSIEIARADDVLVVPNAALRFQPPADEYKPSAGQGQSGQEGQAGQARRQRPEGRRADGQAPDRVWILRDGKLQPVRVHTGLSNGTATAVIDGDLQEGTPVVTGLVATNGTPASPARSPLIPQRGRGNRQGGRGSS
jgi:HlyD family secretion protein